MRRLERPAMAPFLAAWYLALSLMGGAAVETAHRPDLIGTLVYATFAAAMAWLASRILTADRVRRGLVSTLVVLWSALFGTTRLLLGPLLPAPIADGVGLLVAWTAAYLIVIALLVRAPTPSGGLFRGLTTALGFLLAVQSADLVRRWAATPPAPSVSDTPVPDARHADRPDIYLILVDMFSTPSAMQENYGVDLAPFVDSLRALGFMLPARARTNYVHTGLVLPTLLNWEYVHTSLSSSRGSPWDETTRRIEHARLWQVLRAHGYRLAVFPTSYPGTAEAPEATILLRAPGRPHVGFGRTWLYNSPLDIVVGALCRDGSCSAAADFPIPVESSEAMRWKLETLRTLPDSAGPIAAFMHFMGSHEPFIFNADCSGRTPWWPRVVDGADSVEVKRAYGAQIECVASLLLETVTSLLATSATPPVILLQSDHGNGAIRIDASHAGTVALADASPTQRKERLEVFAAYRVPDTAVFPDSVTPVNVLPLVLNQVLGTSLPVQPDRSFWSTWLQPLTLTEVRWLPNGLVEAHPSNSP